GHEEPHRDGEQRHTGDDRHDPGPGRGERVERIAAGREQIREREQGETDRAPAVAAHGYCFLRPICSISAAISPASRAMNASKAFAPRTPTTAPTPLAESPDS